MKTNTTKEVIKQNFIKADSLKTNVLIRTLYRRYSVEIWATGFWLVIAFDIWYKLGK